MVQNLFPPNKKWLVHAKADLPQNLCDKNLLISYVPCIHVSVDNYSKNVIRAHILEVSQSEVTNRDICYNLPNGKTNLLTW